MANQRSYASIERKMKAQRAKKAAAVAALAAKLNAGKPVFTAPPKPEKLTPWMEQEEQAALAHLRAI